MKTAVHQYEDKLLEFAYGELSAREAAAVDAHVRGCARCTEVLTQINSVRTTMSRLPIVPAPEAGLESLLAYAEQTAKRNAEGKKRAAWWRRYLMPMASAAALLLVGVVAWRASHEFDPDPGLLALEMQKEREAEKALAPSASVAQAPAEPAEQADKAAGAKARGEAAAVATVPADEGGRAGLRDRDGEAVKAGERREHDAVTQADVPLGSKRGTSGEEVALAPYGVQAAVPPPKVAPRPQSKSKRDGKLEPMPAAKAEKKVARADQELADDFSNAAQRGASKLAPAVAPPLAPAKDIAAAAPKEAPAAEPDTGIQLSKNQRAPGTQTVWGPKSTPGFGLGAGSTSTGGSGGGGVALGQASAGGLTEGVRRAPSAPPPSAAAPSTAPAGKGSLVLPRGEALSTRSSLGEEGPDVLEGADALSAGRADRNRELERARLRQANLESARAAGNRNDRTSEVKFALAVINAGAKGGELLEALKRVCDAYEALGEYDRAHTYCEALVKQFPNTAAAQEVAERRSRMHKPSAPAKARAVQPGYDSDEAAPDEATKPPKPAEAPVQVY
jgi:hypothetical protein